MFIRIVVLCLMVQGLSVCNGLPTKTKGEKEKDSEEVISSPAPKITYSKETETFPGESVTLDCAVEGVDLTGVDGFEIRWSKINLVDDEENILPLSAKKRILLLSDRISIIHPKDTYQYSLNIDKVVEEDSATYRCTVDFGDNQKIDADVPLLVKVPAYFVDEEVKIVKVSEGDAISIDCQPGGKPPPKVYWERVDENIPKYGRQLVSTNQLDIPHIHRSLEGKYRCNADNGLAAAVYSDIILQVDYKPDVVAEKHEVAASVYDEIKLSCKAEGNPKPEFIWLKDTETVVTSANYRMETVYDEKKKEVSSNLIIDNAQVEDFGKYTCGAVNSIGQSDVEINLDMKTPPVIEKESKREVIFEIDNGYKGRNALPIALECLASGSPRPTYQWTKNGETLLWQTNPRMSLEYGTGTLLIQNPIMSDNGDYQCFAYNELGMAASSVIKLTNNTRIDFVREEPGHVSYEAEIGRPFRLACPEATGYPEPELFWMKSRDVSEGVRMEYIDNERMTLDDRGTLWITHITEDDDTEKNNFVYVCLASSEIHPQDISLAKTIKLKTIPPRDGQDNVDNDLVNVESFAMYTSANEVTFQTGLENSLWCIFGGEPVPTIQWARVDGEDLDVTRIFIKNNGQTLVFKETTIEDKGEYQCIADNRVGTPKIHNMKVDIEVIPEFVEELKAQAQLLHEGTSVTFTCAILGEEIDPPSYEWFFNSRPIQNVDGSKRRIEGSNLVINSVTKADIGNYACKATNKNGYAYGQTSLNVIPKSPAGSQIRASSDLKNLKKDIEKLREDIQKLTTIVKNQLQTSQSQQGMAELLNRIALAVLPAQKMSPVKPASNIPTPVKIET